MSRPDITTYGVTNETEDGYFMIFGDYDGVDYEKVKKDLWHLNMVFGADNFVVLVNSEDDMVQHGGDVITVGNYNVIGLEKYPFRKCEEMVNHLRVDEAFRSHTRYYPQRNRVIRIMEKMQKGEIMYKDKPKLKEFIVMSPQRHRRRRIGQGMAEMLKKLFGVKLPKNLLYDGILGVETVFYVTQRKIKRPYVNLIKDRRFVNYVENEI